MAELIRYGFRANWGLEWPGLSRAYRRWSLALGRFPSTRMFSMEGCGELAAALCVSLSD